MNILILGNGFDIAHGLKTKYQDFLDYCIWKYSIDKETGHINSIDSFTSNLWLRHFVINTLKGDKWIDLEVEIYNVIKSNDILLSRYTRKYTNLTFLYKYIFSKSKIEKDFDLRKIVGKLQKIDDYDSSIQAYIHNSQVYKFSNYKDFIALLYEHLREFVGKFEQYLNDEILSKLETSFNFDICINTDCISLLSFNYTDTCEKLYKINFNNNKCGIKNYAVYVHGKVNSNEDCCDLVLGTHSFFNNIPNNLSEEIQVGFNVFKKHNQRHKFNTIETYQSLLKELKYPKKIYTPVFHVVGHSLDKSDHSILKHIFLARDKSIINIYYHNQEALERMINNITEIIGEEEVMAKVRFIHQHDDERSILKYKKQTT